jgi:hypothetical protein
MATTTPNFGWSVPTSSDLVKNGAVAIETLGDSIDASLVDLKGGTTGQVLTKASNTDMDFSWAATSSGAMTLISSQTMAAVTSKAMDSIFTTTYDNYIINFTMITSASDNISFRLRASGADDSTSFYDYVGIRGRNAGTLVVADTALAASSWQFMGTVEPTYYTTYQVLLTGPKLARNTSFQGRVDSLRTDSSFAYFGTTGNFRTSTAFDGIKIYTNGGASMTGEIRVFGLQNS